MIRYQIERHARGFRIDGKDRCSVRVTMEKAHFSLQSEGTTVRTGLYCYREMIRWIADAVMQKWESPKRREDKTFRACWMKEATAKALNARIYPVWQDLIAQADPDVLAVQRRIFAATLGAPPIALTEELYRHPYVIRDIVNYRAAAIATTCLDWMANHVPCVLDRYPYAAQRRQAHDRWMAGADWWRGEPPLEVKGTDAENTKLWIEMMSDWRSLFSPTGCAYTSLNKTLMNLPGGVTPGILCSLNGIMLERPVYDRLELVTIGAAVQCRHRHHDTVFAHAQRSELQQAIRLLAEAQHNVMMRFNLDDTARLMSSRITSHIVFFTRYLSDFPELHAGRVVGLTQRAIRWHQDEDAGRHRKSVEALGMDRPAAIPPIPLPEEEGIKFLATVEDICEEADRMKHCVASYAKSAVAGHCYLFHVEHGAEMATVEVDRMGRAIQATGPHNGHNIAASWGRKVLGAWGEAFPLPTLNGETERVDDAPPALQGDDPEIIYFE